MERRLPGGVYDMKAQGRAMAAAAAYDDDDDYGGGGIFFPPKDSIIRFREKRTTETRPFRCDGTLLRQVSKQRDPSTVRSPHDVVAAASSPAVRVQGVSTIESLTPFDRDVSDRVDWTKCESCAKLDEDFQRSAEVLEVLAFADALRGHLLEQRKAVDDRKRKRQDEKALARAAIQSAVAPRAAAAAAGGNPGAAALAAWAGALSARCPYPQLKSLCEANSVAATGAKAELVVRLARMKHHGAPGPCPACKRPCLSFTYRPDAGADLTAPPTGVSCSTQGRARRRCLYQTSNTSAHAFPLVDSPDGALAAAGLQAGLLDTGAVHPSAAAAAEAPAGSAAPVASADSAASESAGAATAASAQDLSAPVAASASGAAAVARPAAPGVRIVRYSDRAIVVLGDTCPIYAGMKALGGVWNARLTVDGARAQGWVFRAAERARVDAYLQSQGHASTAEVSAGTLSDAVPASAPTPMLTASPQPGGVAAAATSLPSGDPSTRAEDEAEDEAVEATSAVADAAALPPSQDLRPVNPAVARLSGSDAPTGPLSVARGSGELDATPASPVQRYASSATLKVAPDGRLHVGGNTYLHRQKWKVLGGHWLADAKVWSLPAGARRDIETILGPRL